MTSHIKRAIAWGTAVVLASNSLAWAQTITPAKPPAPMLMDGEAAIIPVGRSISIDTPRDVSMVKTSDDKIANIVPITSRLVEVIGIAAGQTDVKLYDTAGRLMMTQPVKVQPDFSSLNSLIASRVPGSQVDIDYLNGKIVLNGVAPT